jgi:hypothetical protein
MRPSHQMLRRTNLALPCFGPQGCSGFADAYRENAAWTAHYDLSRLNALCSWELTAAAARTRGGGLDSQGR